MGTELQKALTTAAGSGANLLPYDLSPVLFEELLKIQPLAQLLSVIPVSTMTHEYRKRTSHPLARFEGELADGANQNSGYGSETTKLKIQRIWGSVSGFLQATSEDFADALATELVGSVEGMSNLLEYGVTYGVSNDLGYTGDAYQFSGLLPSIYANVAATNVYDAGGDKLALGDLDEIIAAVTDYRGADGDPMFLMMSRRMKNTADGLQTKVQMPLNSMQLFDGKLTMGSYNGIPILTASHLRPASTTTSPKPTLAASTSGGVLPTATVYNYKISSVTIDGEQIGGAAATTAATTASATAKVTLSWTADANALSYMIFRQTGGTGDYKLIDIIPAKTYDSEGDWSSTVATYVDTGAKTPNDYVNPLASGEEQIVIVNANPNRGAAILSKVSGMGTAVGNSMFEYVPLARTKDTYDYMIKSYLGFRLIYPEFCGVIRHAKLS